MSFLHILMDEVLMYIDMFQLMVVSEIYCQKDATLVISDKRHQTVKSIANLLLQSSKPSDL